MLKEQLHPMPEEFAEFDPDRAQLMANIAERKLEEQREQTANRALKKVIGLLQKEMLDIFADCECKFRNEGKDD